MTNPKPLACLSLDLDNHWAYLKTRGEPAWTRFPSYLEHLVPRVLEFLDGLDLKITFFVVGQDAAFQKHRGVLAGIAESGHEIANHSFHHEPWLPSNPAATIRKEIVAAERAIFEATGHKPVGFRGPGFSWSPEMVDILAELGYLYDASTLPTFLGPLARLYYFARSPLDPEGKKQRRHLFGRASEGRRPIKPYFWFLPSGRRILEIPVTTMPIFRLPFHLSYLIYLSRYSPRLMFFYLEVAVRLCRLFQTGLSFLVHPLDFLDNDEVSDLAFFPGMSVKSEDKLKLLKSVIRRISGRFQLVNMRTFAESFLGSGEKLALYPLSLERRSRKPSRGVS